MRYAHKCSKYTLCAELCTFFVSARIVRVVRRVCHAFNNVGGLHKDRAHTVQFTILFDYTLDTPLYY